MAEGVRYIKIAKIDKDGVDQTTTLQSLTELTIPYSSGNITYDILTISEQPTHFVYYVENPNLEWADRADIEYDFTGSLTTSSLYLTTFSPKRVSITSAEKDSLGFYNSTTQQYILNTYPQKDIHFILTGSYSSTSITNIRILANPDPSNLNPTYGDLDIVASKEAVGVGVGQNIIITGSYTPTTPGTEFLILNTLNGFGFTTTSFTGSQLFITSSAPLGPSIETIPEPYFEENFARSLDCQPTLNNILSNRKSTTYQGIDYSSGQITPTNFELLINGNALKAEVQDSNYTLKRHTNPRYEGSRSTSQKLNTWSRPNTIPGYSDVGTYGKLPTIEDNTTTILEFEFGGGTYPEIASAGGIKITQMLNVNSTNSVDKFLPSLEYFTDVLGKTFPPNSTPLIKQYTTDSPNTLGAKVLSTIIGTPRIPGVGKDQTLMVASSDPDAAGRAFSSNPDYLTLSLPAILPRVEINSSGQYQQGVTESFDTVSFISSSIANGDEWYVTIYNNLPSPVTGLLEPFNSGSLQDYTLLDDEGNYANPLAKNGVYKITSTSGLYSLAVTPSFPGTFTVGGNVVGRKGCIIWRTTPEPTVLFNNATLSGVGKGCLVPPNASSIIKNNLNSITKEYGINN